MCFNHAHFVAFAIATIVLRFLFGAAGLSTALVIGPSVVFGAVLAFIFATPGNAIINSYFSYNYKGYLLRIKRFA